MIFDARLLGGILVQGTRMLLRADEVCAGVVLDDLHHQAGHRGAGAGKQMHDLLATRLAIERALDGLDLAADAL